MYIQLEAFGGLAPIFNARKLPPEMATLASNCRFAGGDLLPLAGNQFSQTYAFNIAKLFRDDDGNWLAWPDPWVIDVVRSPIPQDALKRIYWSRWNPSQPTGDNFPRTASQPTQSNIFGDGEPVRRLGVPKATPGFKIGEVRSAYSIQPQTMSRTSPVHVECSQAHPFRDGQRVVVRIYPNGVPASVTGNVNMIEIDGLEFLVANVTQNGFDLRGSDGANYSAFSLTATPDARIERIYADSDMVTRSYTFTLVTDRGEEGPPCAPMTPTDFRNDSSIEGTIEAVWDAGYRGINRMRVYRSASGTDSTNFFFVKEFSPAVLTTGFMRVNLVDNVSEEALGELLPSTEWSPPISGLQGMTMMPNGFLVAFKGNTLYACESYLPHAWPDRYRRTTKEDIVGIAVYGQTLVLATKGKPYLAQGTDPGSLSLLELDIDAPCLSKGSVCSIGNGVVYFSPDGLILVNERGATNITEGFFSKDQWTAMIATDMDAIYHDRRFIALSRNSSVSSFMVEQQRNRIDFCTITTKGRAPAVDPVTDNVSFAFRDSDTVFVRRFHLELPGAAPLTYTWQSKVFTLPKEVSLGAGQVFAEAYPVVLTVNYGLQTSETTETPAAPNQQFTVTVTGADPFRLPPGFMAREYQISITGSQKIQSVLLAESMEEIRQL